VKRPKDWKRSNLELRDILSLVMNYVPSLNKINSWTDDQAYQAEDWASCVHLRASDNIIRVPKRPSFLKDVSPTKWVKVEDNTLRTVWLQRCKCRGVFKRVNAYITNLADSGVPICQDCGEDYEYFYTELAVSR